MHHDGEKSGSWLVIIAKLTPLKAKKHKCLPLKLLLNTSIGSCTLASPEHTVCAAGKE